MAQIRTLGEAITKITDLTNRQLILERDLKAAKAANIRLRTDIDTILAAGSSGTFVQEGTGAVVRTPQDKAREILAINDFLPTGAPDDWRTALIGALEAARSKGGGTIWLPRQLGTREIDNTGLGAIDCSDIDNISLEGETDAAAQIDLTATDGASFLSFASVGTSVQNWGFDKIYLNSQQGAGHVFDFVTKGMSKSWFGPRFRVWQRDPNHSIIVGDVGGAIETGGFLENSFFGEWEFGTTNRPATVPAIKILSEGSLFGPNWFVMHRIHCHGALAPFWWIDNTGAGGNPHGNIFRPWNVEGCRSGLLYAAGLMTSRFGPTKLFDATNLDRDTFELRDGSAARAGHAQVFDLFVAHAGTPVGVAEEWQDVTSITRSGSTATVTTTAPHGLDSGDQVDVANCSGDNHGSGYNLQSAPVTVTGANGFTYAVSSGLATPATAIGQIKFRRARSGADSISHAAGVATLVTKRAHGLVVGQVVDVRDFAEAGYNLRAVITAVPSATQIQYTVDPGTTSPGSGAGTWARAAMDIAILGNETRLKVTNCDGVSTHKLEIDCGNRPMVISPLTSDMTIYRASPNSAIVGVGSTQVGFEGRSVKTAELLEQVAGAGVQATSGLVVGSGGTKTTLDFRVSVTNVSWSSVGAGATATQDVTVTGAVVGDQVTAAIVASGGANLGTGIYALPPQVVAADTVRIAVWNTTAGALTPTTRTWRFDLKRR